LNKVFECFSDFKVSKTNARLESKVNKTIKEVTGFIQEFKHNLAIIKLRQLFDFIAEEGADKKGAESFLKMLNVYCPFMTEELWEIFGHKDFISLSSWPKLDEKKIDEKFDREDEAKDKIVSDILNILNLIKEDKENVYVYVIPPELSWYNDLDISKRTGKNVKVFAVNDKDKYDPTNKSKNAKPGKPAIYLE